MAVPFTPFHFGPGLFGKCVAPQHFSWLAFVTAQVVIDCETLLFLAQGAYPVHRVFHTLPGTAVVGVAMALVLVAVSQLDARLLLPAGFEDRAGPSVRAELCPGGLVTGAVLGALSHPILDGIMHPDVRPFAPWADTNPLLGVVVLGVLHLGCVASGIVGLIVMMRRLRRERG